MKSHRKMRSDDEWRWLIDLRAYQRHRSLSASEREALALLNERFRAGQKAWPEPVRAALARLLRPLYDVLEVTGACKAARNSAVHLTVEEMHRRQTTFWAWSEDEWLEVLCPSEREFHVRHR